MMKKSKLLILILLVFLVLTTAITSIIIQNKEENKIQRLGCPAAGDYEPYPATPGLDIAGRIDMGRHDGD